MYLRLILKPCALNRSLLNIELDLDFFLIAIASKLKDYRLCHHINKELCADFRKAGDYCLGLLTGSELLLFSQYCFKPKGSEAEFYIISNQSVAGCLIPEMCGVDYFMLIKNYFDEEDMEDLLLKLQGIADIESLFLVDPHSLKSNENLLF